MNSERLRSIMLARGFSQAELARRAKVSPATIQQLLNGSIRTTKALRNIAEAAGVTPDWLEGLAEESAPHDVKFLGKPEDTDTVGLAYIGLFSDISSERKVAGVNVLKISRYWFERIIPNRHPSNINFFQVSSNEMAPTFLKGDDLAFRHVDVHDGHPDGIWFIKYGETLILRRVRLIKEGIYLISADNPSFGSFEAAANQIEFQGKVVWHGHTLET